VSTLPGKKYQPTRRALDKGNSIFSYIFHNFSANDYIYLRMMLISIS